MYKDIDKQQQQKKYIESSWKKFQFLPAGILCLDKLLPQLNDKIVLLHLHLPREKNE